MELIGSGFITMTGHPVFPGSIREGGAAWNRLLASLPAKVAPMPFGQIEPILAPSRLAVNAVLARALPNPRFRKLWQGD